MKKIKGEITLLTLSVVAVVTMLGIGSAAVVTEPQKDIEISEES